MRWSGGVDRACKFAGVLLIAFVLAACSRQSPTKQYGLGGEGPVTPGTERDFAVNVGDVVHFQEDSSVLSGEAHGILRNQARWLNQYPQYTITIEGHADERGTREYNLALGARRATAVKSLPRAVGGQRGADPDGVLRQGAADRDLRCAILLDRESPRPDHPERPRRGRRTQLLGAAKPQFGPKRPGKCGMVRRVRRFPRRESPQNA